MPQRSTHTENGLQKQTAHSSGFAKILWISSLIIAPPDFLNIAILCQSFPMLIEKSFQNLAILDRNADIFVILIISPWLIWVNIAYWMLLVFSKGSRDGLWKLPCGSQKAMLIGPHPKRFECS